MPPMNGVRFHVCHLPASTTSANTDTGLHSWTVSATPPGSLHTKVTYCISSTVRQQSSLSGWTTMGNSDSPKPNVIRKTSRARWLTWPQPCSSLSANCLTPESCFRYALTAPARPDATCSTCGASSLYPRTALGAATPLTSPALSGDSCPPHLVESSSCMRA